MEIMGLACDARDVWEHVGYPSTRNAKDDPRIVESVGNMIKRLVSRIVSCFRCDNEIFRNLTSESKQLGVERVIVDPVPSHSLASD